MDAIYRVTHKELVRARARRLARHRRSHVPDRVLSRIYDMSPRGPEFIDGTLLEPEHT